jgi:esterase
MSKEILHSKILGEGHPLIVLHGFLGTGDNWLSLAKNWAEWFEVHLVDQRNHGRSFHHEEHNYEVLARDLSLYLDHYNLDHIFLLGHSMGGKTAMQFALQYPQRVDKLIVVDIAPKAYGGGHEEILHALTSLPIQHVQSRKEVQDILTQQIPNPEVVLFLMKNLNRSSEGTYQWKMNLGALVKNYPEILSSIEGFAPFQKPTLFVAGGNSMYIQPQDTIKIHQLFPLGDLVTIAKAGHWVHAEKPLEMEKTVQAFLLPNAQN